MGTINGVEELRTYVRCAVLRDTQQKRLVNMWRRKIRFFHPGHEINSELRGWFRGEIDLFDETRVKIPFKLNAKIWNSRKKKEERWSLKRWRKERRWETEGKKRIFGWKNEKCRKLMKERREREREKVRGNTLVIGVRLVIPVDLDTGADRSVIANVWIRQVGGVIGQGVIKFHHISDNRADVDFHG